MRVVSGIDKRSLDWPRCEGKAVEKPSERGVSQRSK